MLHVVMAPSSGKVLRNKEVKYWSSHRGLVEMNLTSIHGDTGSTPGLAKLVNDLVLL